ncbi:MAG: dockerin type I repeat-containing protein, partial [Ruminococcus sp.]|nr:dockerin type I repeat-containing protein [Ruminococcus sp.]
MKKFISTMLAVILIFSSISCINTSALTTSDEDENKKKIEDNLYYLIQFNQEYFTILGECRPFYSSSVYDLTCELENVVYDDSSTYNDLLNAYDKLLYADYNLIIEVRMAKWTYELSLKEQNYNNWYSDEDWATFVEKRDALKVALDTGLKSKISDAFYDLLYCYNVMTNRYTLKGDVNKDGAVNIIDVTLIQKYLAGEENFTGAQRMLCGDY